MIIFKSSNLDIINDVEIEDIVYLPADANDSSIAAVIEVVMDVTAVEFRDGDAPAGKYGAVIFTATDNRVGLVLYRNI